MATKGIPSGGDILTLTDAYGALLKDHAAAVGLGASGESGTLAIDAQTCYATLAGDGTTTYPGLAHQDLRDQAAADALSLAQAARWDRLLQRAQLLVTLDSLIRQALPTGWTFQESTGRRPVDLWLEYLNANNASTPTAPAAPTLTATTGGSLDSCAAGSAARVKVCYVSATGDWLVSQPSTASAQVALTGGKNAYAFTLAGNVPAGIDGLLVFRQLAGGTSAYFYDQLVACTAGAAHPAVTVRQADSALRQDIGPPSWCSAMLMPEGAAVLALAYGTLGGGMGQTVQSLQSPMTYAAQAFVDPGNVTLNPAPALLPIDAPASVAEFGRWTAGPTYTAGTIRTTNDYTQALQGYAGSATSATGGGLRLRVASVLDAPGSITNILYTYLDAANPVTPQAGDTGAGAIALAAAVGSTADVGDATIPAGRLVRTVTGLTMGGATSGTVVIEACPLRAL